MFIRSVVVIFLLWSGLAWAQADSTRSTEFNAAVNEAQSARVVGVNHIVLLDQASLDLPDGFVFIPMPAAAHLLHAMGNAPDPGLVGLVFPANRDNWMIVVQFEKAGFIRDGDARDWDVDQLLRNVREGTQHDNPERANQGFAPLAVAGWAEKPRYDASNHRLVWAIEAHETGPKGNPDTVVNYNTFALGREGFFKLNLVTGLADLPLQKPFADRLLDALHFETGKRYEDFNERSDRVAQFGLAGLIAGVASKKLGFWALVGLFLSRTYWRIVLSLFVVAIAGFVVWRLKRRKRNKARRDDAFPDTELSVAPLDQPTQQLEPGPHASHGANATNDVASSQS
jgi:uncharacterized membrane-anchored protein